MNYLAHFHLAGDDEGLVLGAFLGDFIKGSIHSESFHKQIDVQQFPSSTIAGIVLHRQIDAYFDRLELLKPLAKPLPSSGKRFKGILFDLFFDYALTHHWQQFDPRDISHFEENIILVLAKFRHLFTDPAKQLFDRMSEHNLLSRYHEKSLINTIVDHIGHRLNQEEHMNNVREFMWHYEEQWLACFLLAYPNMQNYAHQQKQQLQRKPVKPV